MAIPITQTAPFLEISIAFFVSFHMNDFCSNGFEAVSIVEMLGIPGYKAREDERARGEKAKNERKGKTVEKTGEKQGRNTKKPGGEKRQNRGWTGRETERKKTEGENHRNFQVYLQNSHTRNRLPLTNTDPRKTREETGRERVERCSENRREI
jgi:hypothetical protein